MADEPGLTGLSLSARSSLGTGCHASDTCPSCPGTIESKKAARKGICIRLGARRMGHLSCDEETGTRVRHGNQYSGTPPKVKGALSPQNTVIPAGQTFVLISSRLARLFTLLLPVGTNARTT